MKYLVLLIALLAISCTSNDTHLSHIENSIDTVEYEEVYCPKCNGIGQVELSAGDRVVLGILTFGPGALCDTEQCAEELK